MWHDIFVVGAPVLEKIIRPIVVYFFLVLCCGIRQARAGAIESSIWCAAVAVEHGANAIIGNDIRSPAADRGLYAAGRELHGGALPVSPRRLDQLFEGKPTTLVDHVTSSKKRSPRNAHSSRAGDGSAPQGFDGVDDVARCVLEPGGTFYVQRKSPPADELQHAEVIGRLNELSIKLDRLLAGKSGA